MVLAVSLGGAVPGLDPPPLEASMEPVGANKSSLVVCGARVASPPPPEIGLRPYMPRGTNYTQTYRTAARCASHLVAQGIVGVDMG